MTIKDHIKAFLLTNSSKWRAKALTDKINWLQVYDSQRPLKTLCADKIRVHQYCQQVLGKDICVPIIRVFDTPEDIKPEDLPEKFVLKCNHGWNNNIFVVNIQS